LLSIPALYLILALRNIIPEKMQDLYDRINQFGQQTFAWHSSPLIFWAVLLGTLLCLSYYNHRKGWKRGPVFFSLAVVALIVFGPMLLRFFLAIAEALVPGSTHLTSEWTYLLIIIMLSAVGWAAMSRVIRGIVLSLREQEYVMAARALGASDLRVLIRHILPNTLGYVIVRATLLIPAYILGEVALSFLGVGIQEPVPSWGNMLSASQSLRVLQQFTWSLIPGFFLFLTVLAYNFLGDGLRDALDPKVTPK
jgi:ABC-type dipeptide/oligopeptide/nickel transport system permease subunit